MYDLILRGGTVVDGTRSRPYAADVCIRDGRIARIAPDAGEEAREVVDVSGLTVAPGFIDIHSHSDACPLLSFQPESKLFQGITTEITGNCGTSILPSLPENSREIVQYFFDDTSMFSQVVLNEKDRSLDGLYGVEEYARAVAAHGCTANYGQLVGHGTLRGAVMGFVDRDPEPEEMERLKDLLEVAAWLKKNYTVKTRINTNGLADLIWGTDTAPWLEGKIDAVSVSLNAIDAEEFLRLTRSKFGIGSYDAMLKFTQNCTKYVPHVMMTVVDQVTTPEEQESARKICEKLGATLRVRAYES